MKRPCQTRRALGAVLVSITHIVACTEPDPPSLQASVETGSQDADPGDTGTVDTIHIPMQPLFRHELFVQGRLEDLNKSPMFRGQSELQLAWGRAYPSTFVAALPGYLRGDCGPVEADIELTTISGDSKQLNSRIVGPRELELNTLGPGVTELVVAGTATLREDTCGDSTSAVVALQIDLLVHVKAVGSVTIAHECEGERPLVAPQWPIGAGRIGDGFHPRLLDESGSPFRAFNAHPDAQADVDLRGRFDASAPQPPTLAQWVPTDAGMVEIEAAGGSTTSVEVISPGQIHNAEFDFQLAGTASGPISIVEGDMYGPNWGRAANRIAPILQAAWTDRGRLCTGVPASWFDLQSLTPEVCGVVALASEHEEQDWFTFFGDRIGRAARLQQAGTCKLRLRAPQFDSGAGAEWTISAWFADPSGLHEPR